MVKSEPAQSKVTDAPDGHASAQASGGRGGAPRAPPRPAADSTDRETATNDPPGDVTAGDLYDLNNP